MFKIALKNPTNPDTIHAVIRMTGEEYQALREYMHTQGNQHIAFPYGAFIAVRGRGWYRLQPNNELRALDKMDFAVKCIRRFLKEEEDRVDAELKRLAPLMVNPDLKVATFSTMHSQGDWGYLGSTRPTPEKEVPVPASLDRLRQLASKFSPAASK